MTRDNYIPVTGRSWIDLPLGTQCQVEGKMKGKLGVPFIIVYQTSPDNVVIIDLRDPKGLSLDVDLNKLVDVSIRARRDEQGITAVSSDITVR